MDGRLRAICAEKRVFLRSEAADLGYDDKAVTQAYRAKLWHRVRRGAYTLMPNWLAAHADERHRILAMAVMRSYGDSVALSHVSNLVMRRLPVWGVDLSRVHVTRLDKGSARLEKDLVHHKGIALDGEIEEVDGLLMTRVDRAVVESLTLTGVEQGVVMADGALYRKAINLDQLNSMFRRLERWPGVRSAQLVVRLADGRAESPGESRVRYISWEQGLPMPTPQFEVYDDHGNLIGITDFLWDELGVMGEFDGRVKYGRLLKPGQDPGDVVFDEKAREDALREATQMPMVRFIWRQLDHHQDVAGRVRRLASPRRQLHVPR